MIREANKEKRLRWAQTYLDEASDGLLDVVWTDESTVQLEAVGFAVGTKAKNRGTNQGTYSINIILLYTCAPVHTYIVHNFIPGILRFNF